MIAGVVARPQEPTIRALDFKALATTGTITGGTNTLTVTSGTGFTTGDKIIVEIGGETGAGVRGTRGVGGTWPALSYATTGVMNADTGQAANTYCWVEASENIYRYVASAWVQETNYLTAKVLPKSLVTTATVSGNTLTLATNAAVTATNANVYYCNKALFDAAIALGGTRITLEAAAGSFAASDGLNLQLKDYWKLKGQGSLLTEIFWPKGLFPALWSNIIGLHDDGVVCYNLKVRGNCGLNGYGFFVTEIAGPEAAFPGGVFYGVGTAGEENEYSRNGVIRNVAAVDVFQKAACLQFCTNGLMQNCTAELTTPQQQYTQWQFMLSDTVDCTTVDCSFDSDYAGAAFAMFKTENGQHIRPVSRNGLMEANTASGAYYDPVITFEADVEAPAISPFNPLLNLNTNAANASGIYPAYLEDGFIVTNPVMVQVGYYNDDNDTFRGISVNEFNENVTVTGGSFTSPDYAWPSELYGAFGFDNFAGENCHLSDFTVVGKARLELPNIGNNGPGATVTNCTADVLAYPVLLSTWNSADKSAAITLRDFDITAVRTGAEDGNTDCVRCTAGRTTGDYHFEIILNTDTPQGYDAYGLGNASMPLSSAGAPGTDGNSIAVFDNDNGTTSSIFFNNAVVATLDFPLAAGTVLVFEKRGTLLFIGKTTGNFNGSGAADPVTGVGGIDISGITGDLFPVFGAYDVNVAATLNTGGPAFARAMSTGFAVWGAAVVLSITPTFYLYGF